MKRDMGLDGFCLSQMKRNERINILYNKVQEDIKNNNVYKGKTLAEIKEYILHSDIFLKEKNIYSLLLHETDVKRFLMLLTNQEIEILDNLILENKSNVIEFWPMI